MSGFLYLGRDAVFMVSFPDSRGLFLADFLLSSSTLLLTLGDWTDVVGVWGIDDAPFLVNSSNVFSFSTVLDLFARRVVFSGGWVSFSSGTGISLISIKLSFFFSATCFFWQ